MVLDLVLHLVPVPHAVAVADDLGGVLAGAEVLDLCVVVAEQHSRRLWSADDAMGVRMLRRVQGAWCAQALLLTSCTCSAPDQPLLLTVDLWLTTLLWSTPLMTSTFWTGMRHSFSAMYLTTVFWLPLTRDSVLSNWMVTCSQLGSSTRRGVSPGWPIESGCVYAAPRPPAAGLLQATRASCSMRCRAGVLAAS